MSALGWESRWHSAFDADQAPPLTGSATPRSQLNQSGSLHGLFSWEAISESRLHEINAPHCSGGAPGWLLIQPWFQPQLELWFVPAESVFGCLARPPRWRNVGRLDGRCRLGLELWDHRDCLGDD